MLVVIQIQTDILMVLDNTEDALHLNLDWPKLLHSSIF